MAKIIEVKTEKVIIKKDDGSIFEAAPEMMTFTPKVGQDVYVFNSDKETIILDNTQYKAIKN